MATILPPSGGWAAHSKVSEFYDRKAGDNTPVNLDFTFLYQLSPPEKFISMTVASSVDLAPYGVAIAGARVSGQIRNFFEKNGAVLALTYRDRKTLKIATVNGFSNLPSPTTCDVIEFNPSGSMTKDVTYTVTLVTEIPPIPPALTPTRNTIQSTFVQTIMGSYQSWCNTLVEYINKSGPFPRL